MIEIAKPSFSISDVRAVIAKSKNKIFLGRDYMKEVGANTFYLCADQNEFVVYPQGGIADYTDSRIGDDSSEGFSVKSLNRMISKIKSPKSLEFTLELEDMKKYLLHGEGAYITITVIGDQIQKPQQARH